MPLLRPKAEKKLVFQANLRIGFSNPIALGVEISFATTPVALPSSRLTYSRNKRLRFLMKSEPLVFQGT
jgi:hypothetical protein